MDALSKIAISIVVVIFIAIIAAFFSGALSHSSPSAVDHNTIYFFYGEECPYCHDIMPFVINITKKYPDANIQVLEVWHNEKNNSTYIKANAYANFPDPGVPEVILGKTVLIGEGEISEKLEPLVLDYLKKKR